MRGMLMGALAALAVAGVFAPASAQTADGTSDAAKLEVARQMVDAWRVKDWRKVADLFAEDGSLHSMMSPPVVGREVIYKRIAALGAGIQSITLDVSKLGLIDGDVFMERVDRFVYKGKSGAVPVVGVMSFKDGRISEWREYYDHHQLLSEMGALPAPAKPTH